MVETFMLRRENKTQLEAGRWGGRKDLEGDGGAYITWFRESSAG